MFNYINDDFWKYKQLHLSRILKISCTNAPFNQQQWVRKSIFLLTLVSLLIASPNQSSSNCPRKCNCQANDSIVTCPGKTTLKDERLVQNQQSVGMPATSLSSLQILQIYHFLISRCFQTLQNFV